MDFKLVILLSLLSILQTGKSLLSLSIVELYEALFDYRPVRLSVYRNKFFSCTVLQ